MRVPTMLKWFMAPKVFTTRTRGYNHLENRKAICTLTECTYKSLQKHRVGDI